jgi:ketosteroid isomerase-like protein
MAYQRSAFLFGFCPVRSFSIPSVSLSFYTQNKNPPPSHPPGLRLELAHSQEALEESDSSSNQRVVRVLYDALSTRDVATVRQIVAADLEWWFHGPPSHQFLMRLLTGNATASASSFSFIPQSITSFGPTVLVEGYDRASSISWVHAWTVSDGVITQLREYVNTSLTVTRLGNTSPSSRSSDFASTSSAPSKAEITPLHCPSLWESSVSSRVGKSVPGLLLAI